MREILFRAKEKKTGKWVYGSVVKISDFDYRIVEDDDIKWAYTSHGEYEGTMTEVDPETISQYIGLCDKNGRKIFEGDIVTSGSDSTGRKYYSEVCYDEFNCSCCNGVYGWTFVGGCGDIREYKQYEVVGNVFDNYELLEQPEGN